MRILVALELDMRRLPPYRWETIELCNEAAELGASFAMVVAPGYYRAVMTDDVIENFFLEVSTLRA